MDKESPEMREIVADLKLIKEAVSKSDSIVRFIDAGGALRGILLAVGLLIAAFAIVFYYLLERYGAFAAIPENLKIILFVLIGLSVLGTGYLKAKNFLRSARAMGFDMTFIKLLEELYAPRMLELYLPYMTVIVLVIVFLSSRGYDLYIIPVLAVLFGLFIIALRSLFLLKEFLLPGIWLTATGLLTLFIAESLHPLAVLGITFAAGFVLASLPLYLGSPHEKRRRP